jgi:hypothetical protein
MKHLSFCEDLFLSSPPSTMSTIMSSTIDDDSVGNAPLVTLEEHILREAI